MTRVTTMMLGVVALGGLASAALGESLERRGTFPARYRDASLLRSIAVARMDGADGPALRMAVERALNAAQHFAIVTSWRQRAGADGVLTGNITTGVDRRNVMQERKVCAQKTDGKCTQYKMAQVQCTTRIINVTADLRLADAGGRIVYAVSKPRRDEVSWCSDENQPRSVEEGVRGMIEDIAIDVRFDVAPADKTYRVRFQEGRKALPKPQADQFKRAVSISMKDLPGACASWSDIDRAAPGNPSVVYNLALCAEAKGDYDGAERLFNAALQRGVDGGDARAGIDRVRSLRAALADLRDQA